MAKKAPAKNKKTDYKLRFGALVISVGVVLAFVLGAVGATGLGLLTSAPKAEYKAVEIEGSDGLIGSYGYDEPFKTTDKVIYRLTYINKSSDDRFLQIKATMRANAFGPQLETNKPIDMGNITGTMYSEKKMVKAGTEEVFEFPVVEYTGTPTKSIELEAFKSKTD